MTDLPVAEMFYSLQNSTSLLPGYSVKHNMEASYDCNNCDQTFDSQTGLSVHHSKMHEQSAKENRNCVVCGDVYEVYQSVVQSTCGKECADKLRANKLKRENSPRWSRVEVDCVECGTTFERRRKIVESRDNNFCSKECHANWRKGRGACYTAQSGHIEDERLDHPVRSGWELGVALMLQENNVDYGYESRVFTLENKKYIPDFIVDDTVIEVKGRSKDYDGELEKLDRKTVVIGTQVEADYHFSYEDKEEVLNVI